jgi:hypothetical protein
MAAAVDDEMTPSEFTAALEKYERVRDRATCVLGAGPTQARAATDTSRRPDLAAAGRASAGQKPSALPSAPSAQSLQERSARAARVLRLENSSKGFWADLKSWLVAIDARAAAARHAEFTKRYEAFKEGLSVDDAEEILAVVARENVERSS